MGSWVVAFLLACVGLAGVLWLWARAEARVFPPPAPVRRDPRQIGAPPRQPSLPPGEEGHLAFAHGLRQLADWYLDECEDRTGQRALPPPGVHEARHWRT